MYAARISAHNNPSHRPVKLQVVITTYQTLNTDFAIPEDVESFDEKEWLVTNGQVGFVSGYTCMSLTSAIVGFSRVQNGLGSF